jgi:uncharacterized protein
MKGKHLLINVSLSHPRTVVALMVLAAIVLGSLLPAVKVDTDPENMLDEDEAVRVFHNRMKELFDLNDIVVLGIVNETHPSGVFNPESLKKIHELTWFAIDELKFPVKERGDDSVGDLLAERYGDAWRRVTGDRKPEPERHSAIIERNVIAPSKVEYLWPKSPGVVEPRWLMQVPPETQEEALAIRDKIVTDLDTPRPYVRNPLLYGTMVSEDNKALCVYLPLRSKDLSHDVYAGLREKIATFTGDEQYHITGLPVAEDTFGVEMFIQMAMSAPMAMAVIFVLMLVFFRKLILVLSPMILAMMTVICTMGLLIGTGNTVHIMSSMIPIFLMPIAVLDSIHILSEFFDRYRATGDRRTTVSKVMDELYMPMLYTSLTSAAGFGSLALTPIPPVQVFGLFVAAGVMLAWLFTVTFIPAYIMLIGEKRLANFGSTHHGEAEPTSWLSRFLAGIGRLTSSGAKPILVVTVLIAAIAGWGISRININDNPVKWFTGGHPIRVADRVLNDHFAGTYIAYLVVKPEPVPEPAPKLVDRVAAKWSLLAETIATAEKGAVPQAPKAFADLIRFARSSATPEMRAPELLRKLDEYVIKQQDAADDIEDEDESEAVYAAWDKAREAVTEEWLLYTDPMKDPALLRYISGLQDAMVQLEGGELVGKSTSLADIVKMVHRDMWDGNRDEFRIPDTRRAVGTVIFQTQTGNRPRDLFHLVTNDFTRGNIWVQLRTGDNSRMQRVAEAVDAYFEVHPPPVPIRHSYTAVEQEAKQPQQAGWFGLTYINVEWQKKMVSGMLMAFAGSFFVVFLMMTVLFRSALWGLLSMIPLTVTIAFIYGMVGILGVDYDMPIAVLSSLTLGLAVDFAIHFLARTRKMVAEYGSWDAAAGPVFGEPARAIMRNVIVIAVGFLPLLAAPLNPYKTVGVFLATILLVSGGGTLLILPALMRVLQRWLFRPERPLACKCGTCVFAGLAAAATVVVNVWQYLNVGISALTWISIPLVVLLFGCCCVMSRRQACAARATSEKEASDA